ncbi:S1C family serine protease [Deinococcus peraridilitoris]|uniref:Trypsin-like serine protease with C-terminal PDZ domain protein n=1 Tax=Deinococcus peraridilitoris (strain DSM 19664 / LMG 22246 / CIP 109416 / KR-200) TaxID=937777 RepID=L0A2K0_DEIPD|nr:trypsin-like peptidase domain-containing protein [Deinococcus peraridilitoris]AFZ67664.1 trypsin-like serine protease with C-terminal PDZ domain protein [Deinococcus peraridilitoris DSM 19664]
MQKILAGFGAVMAAVLALLLVIGLLAPDPDKPSENSRTPIIPVNPVQPGPGVASDTEIIAQAMRSSVKLWALDRHGKDIATCSGTIIDPSGLILTNYHCIGNQDARAEGGLQPGELYHPRGWLVVGPTVSDREVPKPTYFAKFLAGKRELDIALIQVFGVFTGDTNRPKPLAGQALPITPIVMGDGGEVKVGDAVTAIGYPGIGGDLITVTRGSVAGFDDHDGDGNIDAIKTDTEINPGNSGGLAINAAGRQIGIPTYYKDLGKSGTGKIGRFMMVNVAAPYITQARALANTVTAESSVVYTPAAQNDAPAAPSNATFGSIVIAQKMNEQGEAVGAGDVQPTGSTSIAGIFRYAGLQDGMNWGQVWTYNGQPAWGDPRGSTWESGAQGTFGVSLGAKPGQGLPDGTYELQLYLAGQLVQKRAFSIGGAAATPPAPPQPDPAQAGVSVSGRLIDADTKAGIPDAVVAFLKPGTDVQAWARANFDENLMVASARSGADGTYTASPLLARNATYPMVLLAKGYRARSVSLEVTADDPAALPLEDLALQRE